MGYRSDCQRRRRYGMLRVLNRTRWPSVALLTVLSAVAGVGCAGTVEQGGQTGGGTGKPKVERLVIALIPPAAESNNPWRALDPRSPWFFATTHESLLGADPDKGDLIPQLATEWRFEPDGSSVRFKLRQGVPFHQEKGTLTAKDIIATHAQHIHAESTHTHRTQYEKVKIEVVNDHEIVLRSDSPNPELLPILSARNVTSMEPFSADDMASLGGNPDLTQRPPVGTGFYEFVSRSQGVNFIVKRVPYQHWRAMPDFAEMEFRWIREASTLQAGLLAGEVHMAQLSRDLQGQSVTRGMKIATAKVATRERSLLTEAVVLDKNYIQYQAQGTPCGYAHCDTPLLNVKVRRALSKAIDRKPLNDAFYGGRAVEVHNPHLIPGAVYWNPDWDKNFQQEYGYDPAAARALLAEAGYTAAQPVTIKIRATPQSGVPEAVEMTEAIAGFWRAVGVDVVLDLTDSAILNAQGRNFASESKNRLNWQTSNIIETQAFRVHNYSLESPRGGFESLELDQAVKAQRSTVDPDKALQLLRQVGDLAYRQHVALPLFWAPDDITYNPKIVESYIWSGVPLGTLSHFERIKAVK
ncbi:MAG: ABC transporter substrate-binding protein [Dehalococcoidia bacterium]|nr:ABC transporter substrate-binding protein [Dehalococcoidia bacterium]